MLASLLRSRGGWCHRADLLDDGWTPRRILDARRAEGVALLRRRWLVLPDAPADIREAARVGGVVTCASTLERYGLWVPPDIVAHRIPHLALPRNAALTPSDAVVHRAAPLVSRAPRSLIDPIENVLAHIATCLPPEDAFAVWESAIRTR